MILSFLQQQQQQQQQIFCRNFDLKILACFTFVASITLHHNCLLFCCKGNTIISNGFAPPSCNRSQSYKCYSILRGALLTGVPGILTFIAKNIELRIFLSSFASSEPLLFRNHQKIKAQAHAGAFSP
jgi:hypothetical protein